MKKLLMLIMLVTSINLFSIDRKLNEGQLKITGALAYNYVIQDGTNYSTTSIMGTNSIFSGNQFTFLDIEGNGLNVFFGINENMQVAVSLPLFSYVESSKMFMGPAELGFLYVLPVGFATIIANPHITIPFLEFNNGSSNSFEQPFSIGINISAEGKMEKIHWGAYLGFSRYFKREKYLGGNYISIAAMGGYEVNKDMIAKLKIIFDNGHFADSFSLKPGIDIKLSSSAELSASLSLVKHIDYSVMTLGASFGLSVKF